MGIPEKNILTDKVASQILDDMNDIYQENYEELESEECEQFLIKVTDYINKHYILGKKQ